MTADPITRARLTESAHETLERCLAAERPHGTYDDTRAGYDAFSRGLVEATTMATTTSREPLSARPTQAS